MRNTIDWHYMGEYKSALVRYTPFIKLLGWYNSRTINIYISRVLDQRFTQ